MLLYGCSSSNWVLQDEIALDKSKGDLKSESQFIEIEEWPTPDRPVVTFNLYNRNEYSYPVRQKSRRYVQQYRPRYAYMFLGLSGAALAFYLANSPDFTDDALNKNERVVLNSAGAILAIASLLNMKPVGEPLDTGEDKLLNEVGETAVVDTTRATGPEEFPVRITAWHNDEVFKSGINGTFKNGSLSFNLIDDLQITEFEGDGAGFIYLEIEHDNSTYTFSLPIHTFMDEFISINDENVPLRNEASEEISNIITNVGRDSQFPLVEIIDDEWYHVLYGISPAFVSINDANTIWLPGDIDVDDLVIAPEESVFGDIEVERNIPGLQEKNPDGIAVIIVNGSYKEPLDIIGDVGRSLELIKSYIINTLGYSPENIVMMENATGSDFQKMFQQSDSTKVFNQEINPDTTDVFIYYMGHSVADRRDEGEAYLLPVDYDTSSPFQRLISAKEFFSLIGSFQTRTTTVLMETDFILSEVSNQRFSQGQRGSLLPRELSSLIINNNPNSAVFFASNRSQRAGKFASPDGRINNHHGIFTYYFCKALKDGYSTTGDIHGSLQRNISYTSRRIHDRAQDPLMFGNPAIWLIPEEN